MYNAGTSNTITVTTTKHTLTATYDETIYKGWTGIIRVTDETGTGVEGIPFTVTVNGSSSTITTDNVGNLILQSFNTPGTASISVSCNATTKYNAMSSQSFTLTVKDTESVHVIPLSAINNNTRIPHKDWVNLENMQINNNNKYTECGTKCYNNVLAGKNGTLHTPAPLRFSNLGLNIPSGVQLDSLKVYMKIRTLSCSSDSANIKITAPTITMLGNSTLFTLQTNKTILPYKYFDTITATIDLTNITVSQLNNKDTYFIVTFPKNGNTNPGRLQIDYVYLEVKYTPAQEGVG